MDTQKLYEQAMAAINEEREDDARPLLAQVVSAEPRHEQAWLALASVMTNMDQAIDCLKRVLALNPNNQTASEWMAVAEREQAREAAAAEMKMKTAELDLQAQDENKSSVPRLGKFLLDYKFITPEQLSAALREQRKLSETGQARRLGDILIAQRAITSERLDVALREQKMEYNRLMWD